MVIDVSDDVDFEPEHTYASLTKPNMPDDFTICGAYRLEAWTIEFRSALLYQIDTTDVWSKIVLNINYEDKGNSGSSDLKVYIGNVYFATKLPEFFSSSNLDTFLFVLRHSSQEGGACG